MNIYDTKTLSCIQCGKCIGEVDYDAEVIRPKCGQCANPMPYGDQIIYAVSAMKTKQSKGMIPSWLNMVLSVEDFHGKFFNTALLSSKYGESVLEKGFSSKVSRLWFVEIVETMQVGGILAATSVIPNCIKKTARRDPLTVNAIN